MRTYGKILHEETPTACVPPARCDVGDKWTLNKYCGCGWRNNFSLQDGALVISTNYTVQSTEDMGSAICLQAKAAGVCKAKHDRQIIAWKM